MGVAAILVMWPGPFEQTFVPAQGSKIVLVPLYLRVPQAAGQVKILILLVKIIFFPI